MNREERKRAVQDPAMAQILSLKYGFCPLGERSGILDVERGSISGSTLSDIDFEVVIGVWD